MQRKQEGGKRDNMNEGEKIYVSERLPEEKRAELVIYEAGCVDRAKRLQLAEPVGENHEKATQNSS